MSGVITHGEVVVHVRYAGGVYTANAPSQGQRYGVSSVSAEAAVHALSGKLGMSRHAQASAWVRHDQVHLQCLLTDEQAVREQIPTKQHSLLTLHLALSIADDAVRSDIELHARGSSAPDGWIYNLKEPNADRPASSGPDAHVVAIAQRAARYIELRGDVFPWRMQRVMGEPHLVRFVNKQGGG